MFICQAYAQRTTVKGIVKDHSGEALIGVNVVEKGKTNGTITGSDGMFSLNVSGKKPVLVCSYIGYVTEEIPVVSQEMLTITLKEDTEELDEVLVIGYGTAKKKDLTGAISRVKAEKMEAEAPRSVQDLLRASAAGLSISMSTDAAGTADLQIRGKNTLSAGSAPLIVLDGVIYDGSMQDINAMDVESIDVLKDASSVAVYGAKAANGVIAITTKKGNTGKPVITFNANVGLVHNSRLPKTVDGAGFLAFRQEYAEGLLSQDELTAQPGKYADPRTLSSMGIDPLTWYNYDQKNPGSALPDDKTLVTTWLTRLNLQNIEIENYLNGVETNWDDIVYQTGLQQDYTTSISNRTDNFSYYWSLGYADREGVKTGDRYRNFRSRLNLESKVTSFLTVGLNSQFATRIGGYLAADVDQREHNSPYTTNEIDNLDSPYRMYPSGDNNTKNPFFDNLYRDRRDINHDFNANLYAILKLPFGLEYQMNFTPRYHWYEYMNHESSQHPEWAGEGGKSERKNEKTFNWLLDHIVRWIQEFGKDHRVEATFLFNAEKGQWWQTVAKNQQFTPSDVLGYHNIGAGAIPSVSSNDTYKTGDALMGRIFYSFKDKYLITASVRRDGYSAFGQMNPRATFPAVALGWVFTSEKFMEPASSWLNYGKLRLSWGQNGNRDIGRYAALSTLTSSLHPYIDSTTGGIYTTSQIWVDRLANKNLSWETTESWNFGLDFGLFDNVLRGSAEFYLAKTKDMLVSRSIPSITGFDSVYDNLGQLNNHGFELTLNATPVRNRVFSWDSTVTFSLNRRKIVHLYGNYVDVLDAEGNVIGRREEDDVKNGWYIGHDTNQIYGYKRLGVWQMDEEEEAARYGLKPGDFKYLDVDDNGVLNTDDKVWQGYTTPRYRASWRNEFNFKNGISLSFLLYGNFGQWGTLNRAANAISQPDRHTTIDIDRWTVDNPTNDYARIGSTNKGNNYVKKDFVRMESIALSYRLPKKWLSKVWIQNATISFTVRNAFVMTGWYLGDPEQGDLTPRTWNINLNFTM